MKRVQENGYTLGKRLTWLWVTYLVLEQEVNTQVRQMALLWFLETKGRSVHLPLLSLFWKLHLCLISPSRLCCFVFPYATVPGICESCNQRPDVQDVPRVSQGSFFHEQMSRPVRRMAWSWCLPSPPLSVDCQWQKLFSVWSAWWLIASPSWGIKQAKVEWTVRHGGLVYPYKWKSTIIPHGCSGPDVFVIHSGEKSVKLGCPMQVMHLLRLVEAEFVQTIYIVQIIISIQICVHCQVN